MRIYLRTTPNTSPVPFEYQQKLVGTIHKWIGANELHDKISLYSFSWLEGGRKVGNALHFKQGASLFVSFHDSSVIRRIVKSIMSAPEMFCGMTVTDVKIEDDPQMEGREVFWCASPIFIKRRLADGSIKQYNYNDEEAGKYMKETLLAKMKVTGMEDASLEISFVTSYPKKRLKLIRYHGIGNKASLCPIIIKGKTETKLFAWNVGIGSCTGIGFGAIY